MKRKKQDNLAQNKTASDNTSSEAVFPRPPSVQKKEEKRQRLAQIPKDALRSFKAGASEMRPVAVFLFLLLAILLIFTVYVPLRNYFQQVSELNKVQAQRQEYLLRKEELINELNRWDNEDYIKEQARIRLGVVEPGETAYRIVDPRINTAHSGEEPGQDSQEDMAWYGHLWNSITTPQEVLPDPDNPQNEEPPVPQAEAPAPEPVVEHAPEPS